MKYEHLMLETDNNYVGRITLNRPEQLNTFNTTMAKELDQALQELEDDDQVRVGIIKGSGKVFCAGIDLNEFPGRTPIGYRQWIECMEQSFVSISRMNKPIIAQVHGVAAANGAGLVAAADLAIAAEESKIGLTAINVGLNCIGPVVAVSRSIGRKKALELLFFGEMIKAEEALNMGLLNKVVPSDQLEQEAETWATTLAQKSPLALQNAKKSFYNAADMEYEKAFQFMNEAFARLCTTEDASEGISAFKEKREPKWKER